MLLEKPPGLEAHLCRERQSELCAYLEDKGLDAAVFFNRHYIYSLTGFWHEQPLTPVALLLTREGEAVVVSHLLDAPAPAVDRLLGYIPNHLFTLKPNMSGEVAQVLQPLLASFKRIATEEQTPSALLSGAVCVDISHDYQYLRRKKGEDEVRALEFTITCADAAYAKAADMIRPGVCEVEVMAAMLERATVVAGEFLSGWGQDFLCGGPGGFARRREVASGELYVLDVGVGVRGYRSDLCRTFAVDRQPTDEQLAAHGRVVEVMAASEAFFKPGQSCREMFEHVTRELDGWNGYRFFHHAGHGVGLDGHEVPRINSGWDDYFQPGDVVAFEPGLYGEALQGGVRVEDNYLITETGYRKLSHFSRDLVNG